MAGRYPHPPQEPPKRLLLSALARKTSLPRRAFCIIQLPETCQLVEAVVSLDGPRATVVDWRTVRFVFHLHTQCRLHPSQLNGVQPTVTVDDAVEAEEIMKANPEFQKVVAERYGITNMDVLAVDPWYNGERFETKDNTPIGRQMMMFLYMRMGDPDDNFYAHPLDLVVDIDLYTKKVIKMFMYDRVPRIPELPRNYHRRLMDRPFRDDIKPLHILQPEGPSFTVRALL